MRPSTVRRLIPILVVAGVLVAMGLLRWSGQLPFGSDNDEYLMVADRLRSFESPLVAGVEGTKYPLGYPALLAVIGWLHLPVAGTALVLNALAVGATSALAALAARRLWGGVAAFAAAGYVAANAGLWGSAFSVMPDTLLTLVMAAIVFVVVRSRGRHVALLCLLVGLAAALKSIGLVIGLGTSVGLLFAPRDVRRWAWAPVAVAVAMTALMAFAVADLPDHTTGYAETFWLVNPYDASKGDVGVGGVLERLWTELDEGLRDVGWAVTGPQVGVGVAQVLAVVMAGLGVAALRGRRMLGLMIVLPYVAAVLVWPYSSIRFGLPLIPIAAIGVGFVVSRIRPVPVAAGLALAGLAALAVWSGAEAERAGHRDADQLAAFHAAVDDFAGWASRNVRAGEEIASPDYRELSHRLHRPVLPVGYTSDASDLWQATGGRGADYFVFMNELVPRRVNIARHLLGSYKDRFQPVYENTLIEVYRIARRT